ncbi:MAG: TonB-dependent siderophore receptor [Corticimicrobacter sp.]|uniref:TonB-dependent siderophore receptor n=1 Tax=Corticimicrobacter sp. TaxID=2678536 RepID=UPI0032DA794B
MASRFPIRPVFDRAPLAAAIGMALMLLPALLPWSGQAAQAQTARHPDGIRVYDVPAGPLHQVLNDFARQSGVALAMDAGALEGGTGAGLQGSHSVAEGFRLLLAGSGYVAVRTADGYILEPHQENTSAASVQSLEQVTVMANALGDITEGSGSYTPGTIATATRMVLTPRETPQSISVVTRQSMDDFNLTSIDDVIRHTPGVSIVTYDSERTQYLARGFAIQNFQYDGMPMERNSAYSAGNTLSDMAIYDRVEVLKGATGLLTGSGDPGATLNLIRKKPTRDFQGHLSAGAGSWDTYRTELDVGGPLDASGRVRGRAVAAWQDKHAEADRYSRRTSVFYGIAEVDLTPDTLLTLGADWQDNDPKASSWGGIPIYDSNGNFNDMPRSFNNGANWSRWEQYTRSAFATLEHQFDNGWMAKLQLNHQINGYDAPLGAAAGGNPDPANGSGTSLWLGRYKGKTTSNAGDFYASGPYQLFGREHELVLGGSLSRRVWRNTGWGPQPGYIGTVSDYYQWNGNVPEPDWSQGNIYTNHEVTRENGLYASTRLNLHDDFKLILGTRLANYKREDIRESDMVVPYLGAVYDLNRNFSVYASYTSIFKPQSEQTESGSTLDPLKGNNYEAGIKAEFLDGRLNASLAVFQLRQDNYAVATGGRTPNGGVAYRAEQGVKTKGFEAEISGQLTPNWQIQAGYNHQVARQNGEKISTVAPEHQFMLYTSYRFEGDLRGLTLGGGARWQSKTWGDVYRPTVGTVRHTINGYWLFDAMARYQFNKKLSASLNVNNIFDKKYYTMMDFYSTYTWGEPRSAMLNVRYDF